MLIFSWDVVAEWSWRWAWSIFDCQFDPYRPLLRLWLGVGIPNTRASTKRAFFPLINAAESLFCARYRFISDKK
jgi:hypothetical protein